MAAQLAVRLNAANPNHHLWNNNGTWWLHYTIHRPDFTKERVRLSLGTAVAEQARRERDRVLRSFGRAGRDAGAPGGLRKRIGDEVGLVPTGAGNGNRLQ